MKVLSVFDEKGQCVLTLTDVNNKYSCTITDIAENQTVIAKDFEANKIVTVTENTSDYKKQQKINELIKKNEAYNNKVELEQLRIENKELNRDIKSEIDVLKQGIAEVGELVFDNVNETENN